MAFQAAGSTVTIAATEATGTIAIGSTGTKVLVTNNGPDMVFVATAATAATTSVPVPPYSQLILERSQTAAAVAAITLAAGKTAAVYFTPGYETI